MIKTSTKPEQKSLFNGLTFMPFMILPKEISGKWEVQMSDGYG
jgi:hypothetical protein